MNMNRLTRNTIFWLVGILSLTSCTEHVEPAIEISDTSITPESAFVEITKDQFQQAQMQMDTMEDYVFTRTVQATGMLAVPVKNQVKVSAYSGGYVTGIDLIPGQHVNKGQVLFVLENPEFIQVQQAYLEAKAQLAYLYDEYQRQQELVEEKIASQKKFLKAKSDYEVTLATAEGLKKRLQLLGISSDQLMPENLVSAITVRAPVAGYVTAVNASKGIFLNATDVAVELIDVDHLHLELSIFEKDILAIKKGQRIKFRVPEVSTDTFFGEVFLVGKSLDENSRIIHVHGHLDQQHTTANLLPGMFVDAEIMVESLKAASLPETAVVEADDKFYILVKEGQSDKAIRFVKREVEIGLKENGRVQIISANDYLRSKEILTVGAFHLIYTD